MAGRRSGAGVYNSRLSHSNSASFSISSVDNKPNRTSLMRLPPLELGSTRRGRAVAGGAAALMVSAPCVTLRVMNFRALLRRATVWRRCLGYCSASPKLYATVRESLALQHALRSCYRTNYNANRIAASRRTAAFCPLLNSPQCSRAVQGYSDDALLRDRTFPRWFRCVGRGICEIDLAV